MTLAVTYTCGTLRFVFPLMRSLCQDRPLFEALVRQPLGNTLRTLADRLVVCRLRRRMIDPKLLTVKQAATLMNFAAWCVWERTLSRQLAFVQAGRRYSGDPSDLK